MPSSRELENTPEGAREPTYADGSTPTHSVMRAITRAVDAAMDDQGPDAALARALESNAGLELALETRTLIGTAIGLLMAERAITSDAAYRRLVETSMHTNVKVRDLAAEMVRRADEAAVGEAGRQD